jgi:hypothetical protein
VTEAATQAVTPSAQFWADLLKMVGFPILASAYFAYKDYRFTQHIIELLIEIKGKK